MHRVVDASIAAKWFFAEEFVDEAGLLLTGHDDLIAPEIMPLELARVVLKKVRRGEMEAAEARRPIATTIDAIVQLHSVQPFLATAMELGLAHQRDPFDMVYVALAIRERSTLVTADRVLYDAMLPLYPEAMVWVGDLPRILES
jgi:predicted nucleic acid-binding protein